MSYPTVSTHRIFDARADGQAWEACASYHRSDASLSAHAEPLADVGLRLGL